MTVTVETAIWMAQKARVTTMLPSIAKAWPGIRFEPPQSSGVLLPYIRVGRVSTAPVRVLIDPDQPHERTGMLMITLVHPLTFADVAVCEQYAGQIADHFADGTQMRYGRVCVSVTNAPHVQNGFEQDGYWTIPVAVPWRCFA